MPPSLVHLVEFLPIIRVESHIRRDIGCSHTLAQSHPPLRWYEPSRYLILQAAPERRGVVGYRLDRKVLAVSVTVLSPEGNEKVGGDEEQDQGDNGRDYERLETSVSIAQSCIWYTAAAFLHSRREQRKHSYLDDGQSRTHDETCR